MSHKRFVCHGNLTVELLDGTSTFVERALFVPSMYDSLIVTGLACQTKTAPRRMPPKVPQWSVSLSGVRALTSRARTSQERRGGGASGQFQPVLSSPGV